MSHTFDESVSWVGYGTDLVREAVADLDEVAMDAPTSLNGWNRRHILAHLAANADAVGNLVHWAATGEPTPMYSSPQQRTADIAAGSARTGAELRAWFDDSANRLLDAMAALDTAEWQAEVVTAQGRTVPVSETSWMRARELMVHAVDLDTGTTFADLPTRFLKALCSDVVVKRGQVPYVEGALDERVAWLTGRPHTLTGAPDLGAWL